MPYFGREGKFGVRNRFQYLASNGDTSVSGSDANGISMLFSDGLYIDVYLNGVKLKTGEDYNTTTANTVAGISAMNANDEVEVIVYDAFSVADTVSAADGGTFSGNVSMSGTLGVTGASTLTGAITTSGIMTLSDTTEASAIGTAALTVAGGIGVTKDMWIGDDIVMDSDSAVIKLGADQDVTITHVADSGLTLKNTSTADNTPFVLCLQTGETDMEAGDDIGRIQFQAPDEGTGTDAVLVVAEIAAISEGAFAADANATKIAFRLGVSEAASEKASISSTGAFSSQSSITSVGGSIMVADGGNFGSVSTPTAIDILGTGEIGIGAAGYTGGQTYIYDNTTGRVGIRVQLDNASSGQIGIHCSTDGAGAAVYGTCAVANYGLYGNSGGNYAIYGKTDSAGHGGVLAYAQNMTTYGILAHANAYALWGIGIAIANSHTVHSDERLKDIQSRISTSDGILAKINQLKPTYFKWKPESDQGQSETNEQVGFIAQEMELILPHLVNDNEVPQMDALPTEDGAEVIPKREKTLNEVLGSTKSIEYEKLVCYLVTAVQELSAKNDAFEVRVAALEA